MQYRAHRAQQLRFRHRQDDHFVASYKITLVDDGETMRIRHRRAEVDQEALTPNGALSMIL